MTVSKDLLNNHNLKRYIRDAASFLICSQVTKKLFMQKSLSDLNNFIEENPDVSLEDIYTVFGSPKQMAENFMETISNEEINRAKHNSRLVKIILSVLTILFIVTLILFLILRPTITIKTTVYSEDTLSEAYQTYISNNEQLSEPPQSQS